jgi:indole-3-glycerol phosphate synthase
MGMDFLKTIAEVKQKQVEAAMRAVPMTKVRDAAEMRTDFRAFAGPLMTVATDRVNIIAEIKRASPSKGLIRENVDPAAFARAYEKGGAAAISVLTETRFFKGSIEDLTAARNSQGLPVLRKDFILSEYQVYESAAIGADAILLIVRILASEQLGDYMALAGDLGMDVLVEVFEDKELEAATKAGAKLIGINNRNLDSFETDMERASGMAARLADGMSAVAASGIKGRKDIEAGMKAGLHNFLVGESIMRSDDPERFLKMLINGNG